LDEAEEEEEEEEEKFFLHPSLLLSFQISTIPKADFQLVK
jgi:hypothetical protein